MAKLHPPSVSATAVGTADELFTPVAVPFALQLRVVRDGVVACRESDAPQWRVSLFVLSVSVISILGAAIGLAQSSSSGDPRLIALLACGVALLPIVTLALIRRYRVELRELEYEVGRGIFRLRIYRGVGATREWSEFYLGDWAIRVQPVELRRWGLKDGGVAWRGFAAVACLGTAQIPLICSRRQERVLMYARSLPIDQRFVEESTTVRRGLAELNGDLID